jgi:hypothetical protein
LGITYKGTVDTVDELPATATQGDLYVVETPTPATAWVWDDTDVAWIDAGPVQGPQGVEGPQGPVGPAGDPAELPADVVFLAAEQTLTNKTLTGPKMNVILDSNFGKPALGVSNAAGAAASQNYVVLYGAAAGSSPALLAYGEANVGLDLQTKGTGQVTVNGQPIGGSYTLPVASATALGGVKVGAGLSVDGTGVLSATVATGFLPLSGGTMTGGITLPTTVQSLTWGTSGYNVFGASGGVAVRSNNTNIVTFTAAEIAATVPITTAGSGVGVRFGSGGPSLSKSGTMIASSAPITVAAAPTAATELANKAYVDAQVAAGGGGSSVTNPVAGSVAGMVLWTGTQAAYDAIATKSATTVYMITG